MYTCFLVLGAAASLFLEDLRNITRRTPADSDLDYGIFDLALGAMHRSVITILYDTETGQP